MIWYSLFATQEEWENFACNASDVAKNLLDVNRTGLLIDILSSYSPCEDLHLLATQEEWEYRARNISNLAENLLDVNCTGLQITRLSSGTTEGVFTV